MYTNAKLCISTIVASCILAGCGGGGGSSSSSANNSNNLNNSSTSNNNSGANIPDSKNLNTETKTQVSKEWQSDNYLGTTAPKLGLKITEVSSINSSSWVEVYNPNEEIVNLSSHQLKTFSIKDNVIGGIVTFSLPNIAVPAKGYAVIAAKDYSWLVSDSNLAFVEQQGILPYWNNNSFIELLYNDSTTDMLSFDAKYKRTSETGSITLTSINDTYNSQSKALWNDSWQNMNFSTLGAENDTPPNAIDNDGDGIPSSAKQQGKTFGGIDIYAMGARNGQKDVFIQHDYLNNVASIPQKIALDKVKQAFAKHNIILHMDVGGLYNNSSSFEPDNYNLGQGKMFKEETCTTLPNMSENKINGCSTVFDYKKTMNAMRRRFFHYVFWGKSQTLSGASSSGMAEYKGKNALITLGDWGLSNKGVQESTLLANYQAGSLMHELGHNFGLLHGGDEYTTYKPNYISVMNYLYQLRGITLDKNSNLAIDRFFDWNNIKGISTCALNNSPCSADFIVDYSSGNLPDIDENNILEANNLLGNTSNNYADWNGDNINNPQKYTKDLNKDGIMSILKDYDDWTNLQFNTSNGNMAFKGDLINKTNKNTNIKFSDLFMGGKAVIKEYNY